MKNETSILPYQVWLINTNNPDSPQSIDSIATTIESLFECMDAGGVQSINPNLEKINSDIANSFHLVAVLRALFTQRELLPAWFDLQVRTRKSLQERGFDTDKILAGLN